jgi:hypothetical protein
MYVTMLQLDFMLSISEVKYDVELQAVHKGEKSFKILHTPDLNFSRSSALFCHDKSLKIIFHMHAMQWHDGREGGKLIAK